MTCELVSALEAALNRSVHALDPCAGGDINEAYRARLADGSHVFVKTRAEAPPGFFASEASGLHWLAEPAALRVPEVLAFRDAPAPAFLVLAWIAGSADGGRAAGQGAAAPDEESFGRGLARLHLAGAASFGLDRDGFIGPLPQSNRPCESWSAFYRERRLEPLVRRARSAGTLGDAAAGALDRVCERIDALVGPPEPPSRLHGDLWAGNCVYDDRGEPWLIDPAAYGGHREVDLAMLSLFGGFGRRARDAYAETFPLAPGSDERLALYQLYPLLVHLLLFGRSYLPPLLDRARRYL